MTAELTISLPTLHDGQRRVSDEARRFNVLACGRRWGKTVFGIDRLADRALDGVPVAWFAPTYKLLLEPWNTARRLLGPAIARANANERRLELVTGGVMEFWTLDGPDPARGRKYARAALDEAAMVGHLGEAWQAAIRPTLTDYEGDAWFLSTPKGRNFFWQAFERGRDPAYGDWASWQMPTATNPHISGAEVEAARRELPDRVFRQEYLAEFLEDAGGVFRGVRALATAPRQDGPADGHRYVMGVDWGREHDFTVLTVYDATARAVATVERFTGVSYGAQLERLRRLAALFGVEHVEAEHNSMGGPLVETLQDEGLPVSAFVTTNESKTGVVRALEQAVERRDLALLTTDDPTGAVVVAEMEAYEQERLPSGRWRFSAPEGLHDDTVVSLALARYAADSGAAWFLA